MKLGRAAWDFPYEPLPRWGQGGEPESLDVVVATASAVDVESIRTALSPLGRVNVEVLLDRKPCHWVRVSSPTRALPSDVAGLLAGAGLPVRYVASPRQGAMALPPAFDWTGVDPARASDWPVRRKRSAPESRAADPHGTWFLRSGAGVCVDRRICGTGTGTRLAVIDDDAADIEHLTLDRVVAVGVDRIAAASGHGALLVAWATEARRSDGSRFAGVAPDASTRLYGIPKAERDVLSLPLAIVRAVLDGADVVLCATYVEGTTSPMLDDALEVATRLGRRGRGAVVVLPTGRETSSPASSVHASLSLGLHDPASDPRVHCVAPGGRDGGWFLWRDGRSKLRPFSNRGPAVRWTAPGDDMAYPFAARERMFHAESSGASAVAAGVVLLVLGCNPQLRVGELHALLARTVDAPTPLDPDLAPHLFDPADVLPAGRDADGHDAKCGYGRLNARLACAAARDPLALALCAMGEREAAGRWCTSSERPYSMRAARWAARALLSRPEIDHVARVLLRHARLLAEEPSRSIAHAPGALARQVAVVLRDLTTRCPPPASVRPEVDLALDALTRACGQGGPECRAFEQSLLQRLVRGWAESLLGETGDPGTPFPGETHPA